MTPDEPPAPRRVAAPSCSRPWRRRSSTWRPADFARRGTHRAAARRPRATGSRGRARRAGRRRARALAELDEIVGRAARRGRPRRARALLAARARAAAGAARRRAPAAAARRRERRRRRCALWPALARAPVGASPGVGPKRAAELARFGLATVEDVLWHLPFRYEDWRTRTPLAALRPGDDATTVGEVAGVRRQAFARPARPRAPRGRRARRRRHRRCSSGSTRCSTSRSASARAARCWCTAGVEAGLGIGPPRLVASRRRRRSVPDDDPADRAAARSCRSTRSRRRCRSASCGASCRARVEVDGDRVPAAHPAGGGAARSGCSSRRARSPRASPPADADLDGAARRPRRSRIASLDLRRAVLPPARPGAAPQRRRRGAGHGVPGSTGA